MNMSQILKRVEEADNFRNMLDTHNNHEQMFDIKHKSV